MKIANVTVFLFCFCAAMIGMEPLPALGAPPVPLTIAPEKENHFVFEQQNVKSLKIILFRNGGNHLAPGLDEIEVFGPEDPTVNLALTEARISVSSHLTGYSFHKIEHLNDGQYGNAHSWIADESDPQPWVKIEFPDQKTINRVVLSRDRYGEYPDRVPSHIEIQVSSDGEEFVALSEVEGQKKTSPLARRRENYHDVSWHAVVLPGAVPGFTKKQESRNHSLVFPQNWPEKDDLGFENLALRASAVPKASSSLSGYAIHKVGHLNDGKSGNNHSWVAATTPAWAEIDLGETFWVYRVAFGSDSGGTFTDRVASKFSILVATDYNRDSQAATWKEVMPSHSTPPVLLRTDFCFEPVPARYVRINIEKTNGGDVRIDELEIYGRETQIALNEIPAELLIAKNATPENPKAISVKVDAAKFHDEWVTTLVDEEYAWLKAYGRADIDPGLTNTPYPEKKHPIKIANDETTLVTLQTAPRLEQPLDDPMWEQVSSGTVRVAVPGTFSEGAAVEYQCRTAISGEFLYGRITTNRLLSPHLAVLQTKQAGGVLVVGEQNEVLWRNYQTEPQWTDTKLDSFVNETHTCFAFRVPLTLLPGADSGLLVRMGIGGRYTDRLGHPVSFYPGQIAVCDAGFQQGEFRLTLTNHGINSISAGTISGLENNTFRLEPGVPHLIPIAAMKDPIGARHDLALDLPDCDHQVRLHLFKYDPVGRALSQLESMADRAQNTSSNEYQAHRIAALKTLEALQQKHGQLVDEPFDAESVRDLFHEVRLAKRTFFFADPDMGDITKILFEKRYPLHPSHNYSDVYDSQWRDGGGIYVLDIPNVNGVFIPEKANLTELFRSTGVARHPVADFDASKIYFTDRPSFQDYWHIMEVNPDGTALRQITDGPFHDLWPCPLPDGDLCFVTTRCIQKFLCWEPQASVLYRMNLSGENMQRLSFANLTEFAPSVARDGRILWTRSEYLDKGADYGHTLWYIHPDGTIPELTFGNTIVLPQGYANGREVPDSNEVSCVMISHFGDLNGPLTLLDIDNGRLNPDSIQSLTPEVPWPGFWARYETFREPYPIAKNLFLVSHSPRDRFALYVLDRFGNREMLYMDDVYGSMCPTPLKLRPVPPVIPSGIDPVLAEKKTGVFTVEDVYKGIDHVVPRGSAKYLRVSQELPHFLDPNEDGSYRASYQPFMEFYASPVDLITGPYGWTSYVAKGDLGLAEIDEDGSVCFEAPAESVLFFQLLDENYNEIQRMRSVVQLQAGERRSCVGCHEDRRAAALPRQTAAFHSTPQQLTPSPWGAGPFDYALAVQPVLDQHCISCHNENDKGGYDLTGRLDENNIPASFKTIIQNGWVHHFHWGYQAGVPSKAEPYTFGTFQSKLWGILDEHYDVRLSQEDERAIKCWVDLSCPLWPDYTQRSLRKTQRISAR
ncbi:MAG: discoidin domain-containing protein [Planctomycetaceae bacterium]|nr:discoidin domain-containing protein [Planctomycetaceae bacterium]